MFNGGNGVVFKVLLVNPTVEASETAIFRHKGSVTLLGKRLHFMIKTFDIMGVSVHENNNFGTICRGFRIPGEKRRAIRRPIFFAFGQITGRTSLFNIRRMGRRRIEQQLRHKIYQTAQKEIKCDNGTNAPSQQPFHAAPTFPAKAAARNKSMSPSKTALVSEVSASVRRSLTILYGCRT